MFNSLLFTNQSFQICASYPTEGYAHPPSRVPGITARKTHVQLYRQNAFEKKLIGNNNINNPKNVPDRP